MVVENVLINMYFKCGCSELFASLKNCQVNENREEMMAIAYRFHEQGWFLHLLLCYNRFKLS